MSEKNRVSYHSGKEGSTQHNIHKHISKRKVAVIDLFQGNGKDITETELYAYNGLFSKWLDRQNSKYRKKGNYDRVKTMEDVHQCKRYRPTETVIQYGNVSSTNIPDNDTFGKMVIDFEQKKLDWSNAHGKNLILLNCTLHYDETTPHAHERAIWRYKDSDGVWCISQEQAMKQAGLELPYPDKPVSQHNNRGMTYTAMCRAWWQDICEQYGYTVERTPMQHRSKHQTVEEFKSQCDRIALEQAEKKANEAIKARERDLQAREQALQVEREKLQVDKQRAIQEREEAEKKRLEYERKMANMDSYIMAIARKLTAKTNSAFANMPRSEQDRALQCSKSRLEMLGDLPQFPDKSDDTYVSHDEAWEQRNRYSKKRQNSGHEF